MKCVYFVLNGIPNFLCKDVSVASEIDCPSRSFARHVSSSSKLLKICQDCFLQTRLSQSLVNLMLQCT
jgi:hypothetical protein